MNLEINIGQAILNLRQRQLENTTSAFNSYSVQNKIEVYNRTMGDGQWLVYFGRTRRPANPAKE